MNTFIWNIKKKTWIVIIVLHALTFVSRSQITFQRTYSSSNGVNDEDEAWSVIKAKDCGYIISGYSGKKSFQDHDALLMKIDDNGELVWSSIFKGDSRQSGQNCALTNDSGIIVTGINANNSYLLKTNKKGILQWTTTFWGTSTSLVQLGYSVKQTTDGGYISSGVTSGYLSGGSGPRDIYLAKTNNTGHSQWYKVIDQGFVGGGRAVTEDVVDGGYVVAGSVYRSLFSVATTALIKTNDLGNLLWNKNYYQLDNGDSVAADGYWMQQTKDNGFIVTGQVSIPVLYGDGIDSEVFLLKTDNSGVVQWYYNYGTDSLETGMSVFQTQDEGYILTGLTNYSAGINNDAFLLKTNANGMIEWSKSYGGTLQDMGRSVIQTEDKGYLFAGSTESFGSITKNVFIVKTDSVGNVGCNVFNLPFQKTNPVLKEVAFSINNTFVPTTENLTPLDEGSYLYTGDLLCGELAIVEKCGDSTETIATDPETIFIPNTFTPNWDGDNDVFYVYGNLIKKIDIKIFDRWGALLFESTIIANGWDGRYHNYLSPENVYICVVDCIWESGNQDLINVHFSLIR